MAIYIKITGNKESTMSDFILNRKKYWFVTRDKFTGIRTFQYKKSEDLKEEIKELISHLQTNKKEFKVTESNITLNLEYLEINNH